MISSLINIHPKYKIKQLEKQIKIVDKKYNSLKDYAVAFIEGMSQTQRERFKNMLENKIECGMSVAKLYGLDYQEFITEVKKELGVE